jgi:putative nucleotidyltransferase with HDIG domain
MMKSLSRNQPAELGNVTHSEQPTPTYPPSPSSGLRVYPAWLLNSYIGGTVAFALGLALLVAFLTSASDWFGILLFTCLAILTEALGIEIYVRNTSVSTSAAPLLAGVLLFGPVAALYIGPAIAIVAYFKYHSPAIRFFFNTSNHLIGGLLSAGLILLCGKPFGHWSLPVQLILTVVAALATYLSTTSLVAIAISIDKQQSLPTVWAERFRWLGPYYAALGVVTYALVFSYRTTGLFGVLVILVPLFMLRYSQMQYVNHTEAMVNRLRTQNAELIQQSAEISLLNEEMLTVLANALDLRDPYVLKHSHHVAHYSVLIAQELGLTADRVEIVHKSGLLHDIGKLGIPEAVLYKPARLTEQEYELVKEHVQIGADLIRGCHSLQTITPFILYHHEHYNGKGYPEGLAGTAIPLEARILGLADAIEAMASDRPYHRAMNVKEIMVEIKRCAGTQFDPFIVDAFIRILECQGEHLIVNSARYVQLERPESLQFFLQPARDELPVLVI